MIYWDGVEGSSDEGTFTTENDDYISLERSNVSQKHCYQKVFILDKSKYVILKTRII